MPGAATYFATRDAACVSGAHPAALGAEEGVALILVAAFCIAGLIALLLADAPRGAS